MVESDTYFRKSNFQYIHGISGLHNFYFNGASMLLIKLYLQLEIHQNLFGLENDIKYK